MITKGIVEEIVDSYYVKVRLPIYDGVPIGTTYVPTDDLNRATVCTLPSIRPHLKIGDVVFVGFEDNDLGKPIILGCLYRESTTGSVSNIIADSLTVNIDAHLSAETSIGDVTPNEIGSLKGIRDNIQGQIDAVSDSAVSNLMSNVGDMIYTDESGSPTNLKIGTAGQVMTVGEDQMPKWSNKDWINPMTTEGDMIYADTNGTPLRLGRGEAYQVLSMDSDGLLPKWASLGGTVHWLGGDQFWLNGNDMCLTHFTSPDSLQGNELIIATSSNASEGVSAYDFFKALTYDDVMLMWTVEKIGHLGT